MSTEIKFGTDGWRGVIDEEFTVENVRTVADAYATYLRDEDPAGTGVLVGYDRRLKSDIFARAAAEQLAAAGYDVILSDRPLSSPAISYAVWHRNAKGGVMITASHNPPQFNGFKIKANYGGSALPEITAEIEKRLTAVPPRAAVPGRITQADLTSEYLTHLRSLVDIDAILRADWTVVTDAMHGSGAGYLESLLAGGSIRVVPIRDAIDLQFGGVNPEPIAANLGLLFDTVRAAGAAAGLAVDGDADRIGAADEDGNFVDSHQIFAILLWHLVTRKGQTGRVIKTVSTTSMIDLLTKKLGLPLTITPIGFKYICENMLQGDVLIGGEESGGIGVRGHLPERDGVLMGLMLLEAMAQSGKTLGGLVREIYDVVGVHVYHRVDLHLSRDAITDARVRVKDAAPTTLAGKTVADIDRQDGTKLYFTDGSWLLLRASGTEPVVRVYAESGSRAEVDALLQAGESLVKGV